MREFPAVEELAKTYASSLASITITSDRNLSEVASVHKKLDTPLPVLLDRDSRTIDAYRAYALPTFYLIDQQQKIYGAWAGPLKKNERDVVESIQFLTE